MKIALTLFCLLLILINTAEGQVNIKEQKLDLATISNNQLLLNLSNLNQQLKSLDSVSVKIFLKIEIAEFVWKRKINGGQSLADDLMEEAVTELQTHKEEIPDFYKNSFQSSIVSGLKINSPALFEKISKKYDLREDAYIQSYRSASDSGVAGTSKIVDEVKKALTDQSSTSNKVAIVFTIKELLSRNKTTEANSILDLVLTSEGNPNTTSYLLLLYLRDAYTSQTAPVSLQKRFLKTAITAGQSVLQKSSSDALDLEKRQNIYQILNYSLPKIEAILPLEFPQALAVLDSLRKGMSESSKEKEDINDRINQSKDKLSQTISEAERTEDKNLKNDLWTQAAELALKEKKFHLAIDCLEKTESEDENFFLWHDQFLDDDVTEAALKEKDIDSAEYAVARIKSKLRSGLAALQIAKFYYKNKDILNAQLTLNESVKKIQATDNNAQKVRGLSKVLSFVLVIDKDKLFDAAQTIVKTVNALPSIKIEEKPESEARKTYVNDVQMVVAWNILPTFRALAKDNPDFAGNLSLDFTQQEYRLVSSVATEIGKFEANAAKRAQANPSKKISK